MSKEESKQESPKAKDEPKQESPKAVVAEAEVSPRVETEEDDPKREGAPSLETPEAAVAPPVEGSRDLTMVLETPESPVAPPEEAAAPVAEEHRYGYAQAGGIMGGFSTSLGTYTDTNLASDYPIQTALDTGVGSAPANRPSTFTRYPPLTLSASNDTGSGSTKASRLHNFEPQASTTVYINPGAF